MTYNSEVPMKGGSMAELISSFELAKRLKIHYQTLYTMIEDGKIPYISLGERSKRFDYDEVVAHLRKQTEV